MAQLYNAAAFASVVEALKEAGLEPSPVVAPLRLLQALYALSVPVVEGRTLPRERFRLLLATAGRAWRAPADLSEIVRRSSPDGIAAMASWSSLTHCPPGLLHIGATCSVALACLHATSDPVLRRLYLRTARDVALATSVADAVHHALDVGVEPAELKLILDALEARTDGALMLASLAIADPCVARRWSVIAALFAGLAVVADLPLLSCHTDSLVSLSPLRACPGDPVVVALDPIKVAGSEHAAVQAALDVLFEGVADAPARALIDEALPPGETWPSAVVLSRLRDSGVQLVLGMQGGTLPSVPVPGVSILTHDVPGDLSFDLPVVGGRAWLGFRDQARAELVPRVRARLAQLLATALTSLGHSLADELVQVLTGPSIDAPERTSVNGLVVPDPQILVFDVPPGPLQAGDTAHISWAVTGADAVTLTPGPGPVQASGVVDLDVPDATSVTYVLQATGCAAPMVRRESREILPEASPVSLRVVLLRLARQGIDDEGADVLHRVTRGPAVSALRALAKKLALALEVLPEPVCSDDEVWLPDEPESIDDPVVDRLFERLDGIALRHPGLEDALWIALVPGQTELSVERPGVAAGRLAVCSVSGLAPLLSSSPWIGPEAVPVARLPARIGSTGALRVGGSWRVERRSRGAGAPHTSGNWARVVDGSGGTLVVAPFTCHRSVGPRDAAALLPIGRRGLAIEIIDPKGVVVQRLVRRTGEPMAEPGTPGEPGVGVIRLGDHTTGLRPGHSGHRKVRFSVEVVRDEGTWPIAEGDFCRPEVFVPMPSISHLLRAGGSPQVRLFDGWAHRRQAIGSPTILTDRIVTRRSQGWLWADHDQASDFRVRWTDPDGGRDELTGVSLVDAAAGLVAHLAPVVN